MVKISVVMPVYNTAIPMLKEAVDSILAQTFRDFEFIIIDDGSANEVKDYLQQLTDPRIRLIRNETNIGITKSLNIGFQAARGKYIARMDSDDISLPSRFEIQYAIMEAHPDAFVCGAGAERHGTESGVIPCKDMDMEWYRVNLLFGNPGPVHPTAFFNHELLVKHHILYDETLVYAQDYGMWDQISRIGSILFLDKTLLKFRYHTNRVSVIHRELQMRCDRMIQGKMLTELMGPITDAELEMHYTHSLHYFPDTVMTSEINQWYRRIIKANKNKQIYNHKKLKRKIETAKTILIQNSCAYEKSSIKKVILYVRYYPFLSVAIRKTKTALLKLSLVKLLHDALKKSK